MTEVPIRVVTSATDVDGSKPITVLELAPVPQKHVADKQPAKRKRGRPKKSPPASVSPKTHIVAPGSKEYLFKPGQSGNPDGRRKYKHFSDAIERVFTAKSKDPEDATQYYNGLVVWDIANASTTNASDTYAAGTASGTPCASSSFTTAHPNEIIIAFCSAAATISAGSGYTLDGSSNGGALVGEHLIVSSIQTGTTAGFSWTGGGAGYISVATFTAPFVSAVPNGLALMGCGV